MDKYEQQFRDEFWPHWAEMQRWCIANDDPDGYARYSRWLHDRPIPRPVVSEPKLTVEELAITGLASVLVTSLLSLVFFC